MFYRRRKKVALIIFGATFLLTIFILTSKQQERFITNSHEYEAIAAHAIKYRASKRVGHERNIPIVDGNSTLNP